MSLAHLISVMDDDERIFVKDTSQHDWTFTGTVFEFMDTLETAMVLLKRVSHVRRSIMYDAIWIEIE